MAQTRAFYLCGLSGHNPNYRHSLRARPISGCFPWSTSILVRLSARKRELSMAQKCFHPSIEGAQHGAKNLADFLDYAKSSGATGAQPSNYMLQGRKGFKAANETKDTFEQRV